MRKILFAKNTRYYDSHWFFIITNATFRLTLVYGCVMYTYIYTHTHTHTHTYTRTYVCMFC